MTWAAEKAGSSDAQRACSLVVTSVETMGKKMVEESVGQWVAMRADSRAGKTAVCWAVHWAENWVESWVVQTGDCLASLKAVSKAGR